MGVPPWSPGALTGGGVLGWCIGGGFQKGEKPGFLLPGGQDAGERGVDQGSDPPQAFLDTGVQQEPGKGKGCWLPPSKPPEPLASTPVALTHMKIPPPYTNGLDSYKSRINHVMLVMEQSTWVGSSAGQRESEDRNGCPRKWAARDPVKQILPTLKEGIPQRCG